MRARFHEPTGGPFFRTWLPYGLSLTSAALAYVAGFTGKEPLRFAVLLAVATLGMYAPFALERRRRPFEADLELLPGRVVVKGAEGRRRRVLRARSVTGATTARLGNEVSLVLALGSRGARPVALRLADPAAADEVRRALGIGPGGFGAAQWPSGRGRTYWFRLVFRILWRVFAVSAALTIALGHSLPLGILFHELAFYAALFAIALRQTASTIGAPYLNLSSAGVLGHVRTKGLRWTSKLVPFAAIRDVHAEEGALVLECDAPHETVRFDAQATRGTTGVDAEEVQHIVAQIRAAADRTKQPGPFAQSATRLAFLQRGNDPVRAWLARIDGLAQLLASGGGYRAIALEEADLWSVLEAPEVGPEVRAAAARILAHGDGAEKRKRIDAALAAERDPGTEQRIRVVLDPNVDDAARELEAIEQHDLEQQVRQLKG